MYGTFVMLKPDALERQIAGEVLEYFTKEKISIVLFTYRLCTSELITAHYAEVIERVGGNFREQALDCFLNKPVIPILLAGEDPDVIATVRKIVGATDPARAEKGTIRGDFGIDSMEASRREARCCRNVIHASDSPEAARTEASLWFGAARAARFLDRAE